MTFILTLEPAVSRISIIRGDSLFFTLDVQDANRTPLQLEDYTCTSTIANAANPSQTWSYTVTKGTTAVTLYLPPEISEELPDNCIWDTQIYNASLGIRRTIARGTLTLLNQITL